MNDLINRPREYLPKINSNLELIEYDLELADRRSERVWANLHVVAIVAVVALTVISVSNNNREIEIAKTKQVTTDNDNKPVLDFRNFFYRSK